ncbi:Organic hydroperoxide resistance transcriptional regulator [Paraliobacillus sp. PM-2]|uniref:MarR family winged helix-turn-helix transcriptional regulator n=1 Tax=Paraliobacillus sp. PM-2 TaxID=1462524 RepID=UPI00061CC6ED|nr:MarR family transcriptional regulator [Paraliobacillus sp. PM-2]CQR45864.1 Organic hydroperoxide resistance transcriptional regulator [Paraliobacillus sp. PM-2]
MTDQLLKLEDQLCFSLYATTREITKRYRPLLEELQVTYPQYLVLLVLWEKDGITVKELGKRLYLDSGTLTPMLKRMEENQLIVRKRSAADERSVVVTLTIKGKEAKEQAACIPARLLENVDAEPEEMEQVKQTLMKMLHSLHELNEKGQ